MEEIENRVLELIRSICRLHRWSPFASSVSKKLNNEGFRDVSINLVQAICNKLSNESDKYMASAYEHSENAIYYKAEINTTDSRIFDLWSERYFLLYVSSIGNSHSFEVVDMFNNKSM
jgi:hypothetical protein